MTEIHIEDLLYIEKDEQFVAACYRSILGREPDRTGFSTHIDHLKRGLGRLVMVEAIYNSLEGKGQGRRVVGLQAALVHARLSRLPLIGSFVDLLVPYPSRSYLCRKLRSLEAIADVLIQRADEERSAPYRRPNRVLAHTSDAERTLSPRGRLILHELRTRNG